MQTPSRVDPSHHLPLPPVLFPLVRGSSQSYPVSNQNMNIDLVQRHELLKQLAVHENAAQLLRSQLNRLTYVQHLPPEILSMIFTYCVCFDPVRDPPATSRSWTVVLHVCQRWREVALNTTLLWAMLALPAPAHFLEAALEHSKASPLDVTIHRWSSQLDVARQAQAVLSQMPRIRTLRWYARAFDAAVFPALACTPQCHTFAVGHVYDAAEVFGWDTRPLHAMGVRSSYVKHYGDIYGVVKTLPLLRHLIIGPHVCFGPSMPASLGDALQALAPLRELESLRLSCIFGGHNENQPDVSIRLSFPKLRSLVLSGQTFSCCGLLARLDFPATTSVRIIDVSQYANATQDILAVLPKIIGSADRAPVISLSFHGRGFQSEQVTVAGWKTLKSVLDHCPLPNFSLALPRYGTSLEIIFAQIPLGRVRSLFMHATALSPSAVWGPRLRQYLNDVEELRLSAREFRAVHRILREPGVLPRLRVLQLDRVLSLDCPREQLARGCKYIDCFHLLEHLLQRRAEAVQRVPKLVLRAQVPIAPARLQALAAHVEEIVHVVVSADGNEGEYEPWIGRNEEWDGEPYVSDDGDEDSEDDEF
ncbi:hypothetical protein PsYK624_164860 [Phanerochaete sordida]|uniref:F-box domain-containing protein n=1 Tax=Phanerochaete sordida TaxID=48140 RepID=A0A9P3GR00_9APHY|nr:hypothetical protein PsYK624_164860 [Phanerochaete sordida]